MPNGRRCLQTINITFCVKGTERPYQMNLMTTIKRKLFCAACKLPLFSSKTKFNSGTGWPFYDVINQNRVKEVVDKSLNGTWRNCLCTLTDIWDII
jgi:peptide-methionine (R)-S-oxide reductase